MPPHSFLLKKRKFVYSYHGTCSLDVPLSLFSSLSFWNPEVVRAEGLDPFMRGMSNTVCQELDAHISPVLRNNLFNVNEGSAPRDLYALNIERAREHGIPNYNQLRAAYLGGNTQLADNTDCFLNEDIFQPEAGAILASLYDGPGSADCFPALLSEVHVPGAMVGETQQVSRTFFGLELYFELFSFYLTVQLELSYQFNRPFFASSSQTCVTVTLFGTRTGLKVISLIW